MSLKRKYTLNMPQLLWGGLSENWLLKELGDLHWQQITDALNTPSDRLTDSRGERLYASFVRVQWSGINIHHFTENDALSLGSKLSRYGSKMFFSDTTGSGASGELSARLLSVFSTRKDSDNTQLAKGHLKRGIKSKKVKVHKKLPELAQEYLSEKSLLFDEQGKIKPEAQPEILYRRAYTIDAYDDINGVGLLYFASYPKISDKCERHYLHSEYALEQDWLQSAGVVARDIHYYGNANAEDVLIYELNELTAEKGKVTLVSSLYRSSDEKLIARITTIKELVEGVSLLKKSASYEHVVLDPTSKSLSTTAASSTAPSPSLPAAEGQRVNTARYDQSTLNQIVIDFLSSMLAINDLTPQSDLHALGIESVVYQELSEFLFDTHQLPNNPSRFYGTSTVAALTNDLLESLSEGRPSSSSTVSQEKPAVSTTTTSSEAIAIIGMSGRFPGSPDVETFWEHLQAGKDLITEVPKDRWDWQEYYGDPQQEQGKTKSKWGGFMEGIDAFDPLFFGISPHEAMLMDPQQRLTLEAVWHALEDAGIAPYQ
ncbi:MAG: Pnap_2097 family protein, partial [Bacteroidota bacterium]